MSDATTQRPGPAVRASDAERDQVVALLQRHFADGRLTQAELEERAGAAYAARTRDQLRTLTTDLPAAQEQPTRPAMDLDPYLLCLLLCVCPPAGLAYWLLSRRKGPAADSTRVSWPRTPPAVPPAASAASQRPRAPRPGTAHPPAPPWP